MLGANPIPESEGTAAAGSNVTSSNSTLLEEGSPAVNNASLVGDSDEVGSGNKISLEKGSNLNGFLNSIPQSIQTVLSY